MSDLKKLKSLACAKPEVKNAMPATPTFTTEKSFLSNMKGFLQIYESLSGETKRRFLQTRLQTLFAGGSLKICGYAVTTCVLQYGEPSADASHALVATLRISRSKFRLLLQPFFVGFELFEIGRLGGTGDHGNRAVFAQLFHEALCSR